MADQPYTQDGTPEVSAAEVEAATEALRREGLIEAELEDEYLRDAAVAVLTAAASVRQGELERLRTAMRRAMDELGVPTDDYPAPVTNAWDILLAALTLQPALAAPTEGESE